MDELRRRRSIWLDGRQSRSKRAAEEPQRSSFTLNRFPSFFHRRFSADGLPWQLQPISPEHVPHPRYKMLSRSTTMSLSYSYKPTTAPESHQEYRVGVGDSKKKAAAEGSEKVGRVKAMKTVALGGNCWSKREAMEEDKSHTFNLQRSHSSQSWLASRSKSSRLLQDSLSQYNDAFVPLPSYERLSQSIRLFSEEPTEDTGVRRLRKGGWARKVIRRLFFHRKIDSDGDERKEGEGNEKEKTKKKRSSWLPDPERRWPVTQVMQAVCALPQF